ncbi:hypothetical protein AB4Z43_09555 [Mesorhizobium sp. 2RAF45]|uniref:hypothetical protein n=1 Tax=Mesorhizobium sp. 2RAF45 TaxID=3233001 RepID=UPI003F9735E3
MAYKHVLLLQVFLRFEIEHCDREVKALRRALGPSAKPCMHEKRHLAFILKTGERPQELVDRLRPVLDVDNFADFTAVAVLGDPAGKHGGLNSLVTHINVAFATLNTSPTKYLEESQVLVKQYLRKDASR